MKQWTIAVLSTLALGFLPSWGNAPAKEGAAAALNALYQAEWERSLRESPENASQQGDRRYAKLWTDLSPGAIDARAAADREALAQLHAINPEDLPAAGRVDHGFLAWRLQDRIERQRFRDWLQPVSKSEGPQQLSSLAGQIDFATARDYEDWIARLDALPAHIVQVIALLRQGLRENQMPPRVLLERADRQIGTQIVEDAARSPFYAPFLAMDPRVPAPGAEALRARARESIRDRVVPAFREFARIFHEEYLPHARASIAASELPQGRAYYDFLLRHYTTTAMGADEIHALGLSEVARIRTLMEKAKLEAGFTGPMPEFFASLRSDPKYFYRSSEELLQASRALAKRIDPALVKAFATIPRTPYGVEPIPANLAPDSTTAYYQPGAADGSTPGTYAVNLYRPEARPRWEMLPLTLHEAVPGHHFQFARALELPEVPTLRRVAYTVSYSEGWGLYAEQIGYDLGLYGDPIDRFGQLSYEMWRAVRLVVDTGMHAKGWSRDQAIAFFRENVPKTDQDIVNEVDRYIEWPGQATAYKIGQLRISALRARAKAALGERFDLRRFHDAVLATGSVPLSVLDASMTDWIAAEQRVAR
jgi:uncharacterized protein (DUF885 family)